MEKYILDTNTWIEHFHRRPEIRKRIKELDPDQLYVSEVTLAEMTFGALNSKRLRTPYQRTAGTS